MKKIILLTLGLFLAFHLSAQQDSVAIRQIDEQVWLPFIEHYNNLDAAAFNDLHTSDLLRGGPWGLRTGEEYFAANLEHWPKRKAEEETRRIEFTFEYRVVKNKVAYQVGYYRVVVKKGGNEKTYFGQFHVVLRQVNGIWKIAQDWDAEEINGRKINEEDFMKNAEKGLYK